MKIVDSHCHLDMLAEHEPVETIIARARATGVCYIQTICTRIQNFSQILSIAKAHNNVFASVGVHPSEVKLGQKLVSVEELISFSADNIVIGLGETGLDYYYNKDTEQLRLQRESFQNHIIASQHNLVPLIIHTRHAEHDTKTIIKAVLNSGPCSGVIHCFSSDIAFARSMLDLGLYISISGIVTFAKAQDLHEVVKFVPLDRMLVETDAPYLAPAPMRGKINEPAYLKYTVESIAELKKISTQIVSEQTTNNFFELFRKAVR